MTAAAALLATLPALCCVCERLTLTLPSPSRYSSLLPSLPLPCLSPTLPSHRIPSPFLPVLPYPTLPYPPLPYRTLTYPTLPLPSPPLSSPSLFLFPPLPPVPSPPLRSLPPLSVVRRHNATHAQNKAGAGGELEDFVFEDQIEFVTGQLLEGAELTKVR
jgi:hypothetical protein